MRRIAASVVLALAGSLVAASPSHAQTFALPAPPPGVETFRDRGIEFSRVVAPNVQAFTPTQGNIIRPIGGGSWDFSISRTELTVGPWVGMVNSFSDVPIPTDQPWSTALTSVMQGFGWGGYGCFPLGLGSQGRRVWGTSQLGEALPINQMGWFGAALYCNWLSNDQATTVDALLTGTYDLRNFNLNDSSTWISITRSANAKYWIPSYDEWAVASFYDVNRQGPGVPGWWNYLNSRDRLPIPGPPGAGETSSGWDPGPTGQSVFLLPVASYANSQSPWGLFDTSGTFPEMTEDQSPFSEPSRIFVGSRAGPYGDDPFQIQRFEQLGWIISDSPIHGTFSFRIASSTVPAPGSVAILCLWMLRETRSERKRRS